MAYLAVNSDGKEVRFDGKNLLLGGIMNGYNMKVQRQGVAVVSDLIIMNLAKHSLSAQSSP